MEEMRKKEGMEHKLQIGYKLQIKEFKVGDVLKVAFPFYSPEESTRVVRDIVCMVTEIRVIYDSYNFVPLFLITVYTTEYNMGYFKLRDPNEDVVRLLKVKDDGTLEETPITKYTPQVLRTACFDSLHDVSYEEEDYTNAWAESFRERHNTL